MKYRVKDITIRADRDYLPGEIIDLSEDDAAPMLHHLDLLEEKETSDKRDKTGKFKRCKT